MRTSPKNSSGGTITGAFLTELAALYGFESALEIAEFGGGLINRSYALSKPHEAPTYLLQQINTGVFRDPRVLDDNLCAISMALAAEAPSPNIAYQAARQFGIFARQLMHVPAGQIKPSIPQFHDLPLRLAQFEQSLITGNSARVGAQGQTIAWVRRYMHLADAFGAAQRSGELPLRLMHHDTKISNVLFDGAGDNGLCVVDLDTVMPGTIVSDIGDMLRTYLCPVDENHADLDDICIRETYYSAVVNGYAAGMASSLSTGEIDMIPFAGKFMMFMQAVRFLTDYFNDDAYYGASYADHNLNRALNQLTLLDHYCEFVDQRMRP